VCERHSWIMLFLFEIYWSLLLFCNTTHFLKRYSEWSSHTIYILTDPSSSIEKCANHSSAIIVLLIICTLRLRPRDFFQCNISIYAQKLGSIEPEVPNFGLWWAALGSGPTKFWNPQYSYIFSVPKIGRNKWFHGSRVRNTLSLNSSCRGGVGEVC